MKNKFAALIALICLLPLLAFGADLTATWPAAPAAEQVTHYEVYLGTNGVPGSAGGTLVATVENPTVTFSNVVEGVTYSLAVKAVNLSGPGVFSDNAATAGPPSKPGTPVLTVDP